MCDLASLEHADNSNLVTLFQKAGGFLDQVLQVVLCYARAYLYTLNLLLFLLGALVFLLRLVLIASKINDFAHRRVGGRRNHDKVEALLFGDVESLAALENAELRVVGADDPDIPEA